MDPKIKLSRTRVRKTLSARACNSNAKWTIEPGLGCCASFGKVDPANQIQNVAHMPRISCFKNWSRRPASCSGSNSLGTAGAQYHGHRVKEYHWIFQFFWTISTRPLPVTIIIRSLLITSILFYCVLPRDFDHPPCTIRVPFLTNSVIDHCPIWSQLHIYFTVRSLPDSTDSHKICAIWIALIIGAPVFR